MNSPLFHIAFYHFVRVQEPDALAQRLRELCAPLLGSILVAQEGINGMPSGTAGQLDAFEQALQTDEAIRSSVDTKGFEGIVFKRTACITAPFKRLKIHAKREIVPLGIQGVDAPGRIDEIHANDVSPREWRELIKRPDVVLLDNRNSFEYRLGRFEGAIDPGVVNFRDFPEYVQAHAEEWKRTGKTVAMYCTGGIRCEKSSVWMQDMGLKVAQLQGGILNYFQQMPDAEADWQGECFVFDNRVALDTKLQETATSVDDVYNAQDVVDSKLAQDAHWRLQRAKRLDEQ
ncbi:MAG: rhodanese-like domain-containing protein [Brachymonas sp.]